MKTNDTLPKTFTFRTNAGRFVRNYKKNHPDETGSKLVITKINEKAFVVEKVLIEADASEANSIPSNY
jgi:hypothetical protein